MEPFRSRHLFEDEAAGDHPGDRSRRVVRNGQPTNDLVFSAYAGANAEVFPKILDLYVRPDSVVADVTYGKGAFWRNVPKGLYRL